jgi:uncharacterized protein (TIGR03032 family)
VFGQNHLQLNSIAAGDRIDTSFFSASTDEMTVLRPGDPDFPVDGRGVVFSGATREVVCRGLTRPHSLRFDADGRLWVDNSGYGEVGVVESGAFHAVQRLPGWTRGLLPVGDLMFVGTSRVLPRFHKYAPGLDVASSTCGVHALETRSGRVLASITWPSGDQLFALDWAPAAMTRGLPFRAGTADDARNRNLFYAFQLGTGKE